ncbi:hypothetical protein EAF00_002847 [Botryotinia globosa]|nr:hypothetical protein EAF00_002847 [Botryotinia globosa]
MDPLSVSASISGLISILDLIAGKSYKYVKEVRGSTQEVKKLVNEMTDLYGILNKLRLVVSRFDNVSVSSAIQFQHIDTCRTLLDRIKERLDKADRDNISSQKSAIGRKFSNLGRALIWPFSVVETRALIDDMTTQKSTLMFALQVDGMNALFDALSDRKTQRLNIEAIRANVLGLRNEKAISLLNQKQKKIIEWIAPYDPSQRHQEIATKLRQPGTGQWFTKGDEFKCWLNEKASKLWLYGIRLAFFYCDYKDTRTQDPLNILGSLVKQLVLADRRGFAELEACWVNYCPNEDIGISNTVSAERLCELLQDISRHFDTVHLVVDALDECGDGRLDIVRLLTELNATKDSNIKMILASRLEPDIERYLVDFTKLSIAAHRNDLELYVHSKIERRLRETQKVIWNQELREEIAQRLVDEARVRWVTCQLDRLCDLDTLKNVKRALHSLPPTLVETYERILDRINLSSDETKELVHQVLIWTVCAVQPLSLAQLLEAVSIDLSDKHLDRDGIPNEQSILKRCSSLVRKTEGPWGIRIELAHFSVKEFLLLQVQNDRYATYRVSQDYHNVYMGKICLTYILFEDFRDISHYTTHLNTKAICEDYAFYNYAAKHFSHHLCGNTNDGESLALLKLLFDPIKTDNFVSWAQNLLSRTYSTESHQGMVCSTSTLHFAILLSLSCVVEWLISDTSIFLYLTKDSDAGDLLACAIAPERVFFYVLERSECKQHPQSSEKNKILEYLVKCTSIINRFPLVTGQWGKYVRTTPMQLAIQARFGWDILLQQGAQITDSCIEALQAELEHSFDFVTSFVQITRPRNVPALMIPRFMQFAQQFKRVDKPLADSFFNFDAEIDSTGEMVSLHIAITFGQTHTVIQILKKKSLEINSGTKIDGLSALHRASNVGHLEIVKILLNHGASLDLPTSIDGTDTRDTLFGLKCVTSFHLAVANGHLNVARFLEEYGADINKPDTKSGITPLHSATRQSTEMIKYLLQSPRQRHSPSSATLSGWTVLMEAAEVGSFDTFKLALQNSRPSAVLLQSETGFNWLHLAVSSRFNPCQKLAMLRQTCINPCTPTADGSLPLHLAVCRGFDIFRKTLNFTLKFLSRSHQIASIFKPIISRSFLQGSDSHWSIPCDTQRDEHILNHLTDSGQSILHEIVTNHSVQPSDNLKMLELLLVSSRDVNMEIEDGKGRSPLLALCDSWLRMEEINVRTSSYLNFLPDAIRLLLRYGAVATQQDNQGNTAIHYLCKSARFTIYGYRCKVDSTEFTRKDDSYCQYGEDKYSDEYSEEFSDSDEEYSDEDDDSFDDFPAIKSDFASPEVYTSYNDTSTSVLLANKLNITPLHLFFGDPKMVRDPTRQSFYMKIALLLLSAASMDQLNKTLICGRRLLQTTLERKDDQLTLAILDTGIDTVSPDEGTPPQTALETLCIHGSRNNRVIRVIIMNHVDQTTLNADGSTMLHLACIYKQINILEELLHAGWKTNVPNRDEELVILQGIVSGDTKIVKLLLRHGSSLLGKYVHRSIITFSLSIAPNTIMCQFLNENGINDWQQEATMSFWGQFLPEISTMRTRYSSPPSSGITEWFSVAIERVTPLHVASFIGNETVIQYALDLGNNVEINLAAKFGTTPLFFAVYGGNFRNMEVLLSRGADFSKSPSKTTLLHLAAATGDEPAVRLLLQYGADTQARDYMGRTPASVAFDLGHKSIVNILKCNFSGSSSSLKAFSVGSVLDPELELVRDGKFVSAAIEEAIRCQDVGTLKSLLKNGHSLEGSCYCGCSPLLVALTVAGKEISILLAEAGASLDGVVVCPIPRRTAGFTPLHLAALYGNEQLLEIIIETGQPESIQSVHPLHISAHNGHSACVRILLSHAFDGQCGVNDKRSQTEPPCLQEASMRSFKDGKIHIVEEIRGTSLHYASLGGHIDVMTELLRFGADLNARDRTGSTPLHIAARCGYKQACDLLLSAGASVLSRDNENRSPIHCAVRKGYHHIVKIMMKQLASSDILLHDGDNLLKYACICGNSETIEALISAGLNISLTYDDEWPAFFIAMRNRTLTEEFRIKLLANVDNLHQTPETGSLLIILCFESLLLVVRELLRKVPKDELYQYVNYISANGTALYRTAATAREQSLKIAELLIDHGAELEITKPSHGTPLMVACYYGYYDMVALLLKKGARITCNKQDGTQMTAVQEARHHLDIVTLLKNFEDKGVEALNEPRTAILANMVRVEECMNRISEEEEQEEDREKEGKRNEEEGREGRKEEGCEKK